jgi:TRAP-type C4-dicarboxylate transport system, periplasmic component
MSVVRIPKLFCGVLVAANLAMASTAALAQNRQFSFAYDQPKSSGYGVGAEMFNKKLMELSKGTLSINQYPSAQLGTEAQTMQKVQTGDIRLRHAIDSQRIDRTTRIRCVLDPLHFPQ